MKQTFEIKTYGKRQLAKLYYPELSGKAAYRRLLGQIASCPKLKEKLKEIGRSQRSWFYSPSEVKCIVESMGPPLSYQEDE